MAAHHTLSLQLLETGLTSEFGFGLHAGSPTHDDTLRFVAQLVRVTEDDTLIERIILTSHPGDYAGNTMAEVPKMIADARAKGFGNSSKRSGRKKAESPTDAARRLIDDLDIHFFHNSLGEAYATWRQPGSGPRTYPVKSSALSQQIQLAFFEATGKALGRSPLEQVLDLLEAQALFRSPMQEVHIRLAGDKGEIYIDLGRADGQLVRIDQNGWCCTTESPYHFWRPPGFGELPIPELGGDLGALKVLLDLEEQNFILLLAVLVSGINPNGPYYIALIQGEHGSGKSFLCSIIKRLLDPAAIERQRLPATEHDLAIHAMQNRVLVFDNASSVKYEMSDALCSLATGSGFTTRKYYTDNESRAFKHKRPIVINGIGDFASRPDLLDRSIQIKLPPMPAQSRKTEAQLDAELAQLLPGLVGALFDVASFALAHMDSVVAPTTLRMADAAHWLVAAEGATDLRLGTFITTLEGGQQDMMIERAANDPLVIALMKFLENRTGKEFLGRVGELHDHLMGQADRVNSRLPPTPAHLSNALQRLAPVMVQIGVHLEFEEKTRRGRPIHIWVDEEERPFAASDRSRGKEPF